MKFSQVKLGIGPYSNKKISLFLDGHPEMPSIKFQIPRMYIPFGLNGFVPEVGDTKWNVDFSLNESTEDFEDFVNDVENKIIQYVSDNSLVIFGTSMTPDQLKNMFNSNIKGDKFRLKFDTNKSIIFNHENEQIHDEPRDGLYSKRSGTAMVELQSVYFLNKKFGLVWKLCQMKIYEPQRLKGFQFRFPNGEH